MEETGISDSDFRQLLLDFSRWFDGLGYIDMLKVLYTDHVPIYTDLIGAETVMSLLQSLIASGSLSSTKLTILYDTIKLTGQFGFKSKIVLPLSQRLEEHEVYIFTQYRQFLLKLGMRLTREDIDMLDVRHNEMPLLKKYTDSWHLILDLEQRKELCEENIASFIEGLPSYLTVKAILGGNEEPSTSKRPMLNQVDNGEASTLKRPKLDIGYCGPTGCLGECAMSSHHQQPPPARQLLPPQQLQQLPMQSLQRPSQGGSGMSSHQQQPPPARQLLPPHQLQEIPMQSLHRPSQGYSGIRGSAMSSHQEQRSLARQLLLHQQLQQLQVQDAYNYLAWNQPVPDSLSSALQDKIIKDYLTRKQKILYQDVNRMTPAIWHKYHVVDIAEVFTELSLLKSGKEERAQNKSTCIRKEGEPTSLTEVLRIIKSTSSCKVLITGKAGMGKTTLLKYITYKWATGTDDVHNVFAGKLLFLIKIGDIKAGTDILEIMMKNISTREFICQTNLPFDSVESFLYNHADNIVILLDGYDELQSDAKDPIYLFKGLELKKSTVVITSRPDNMIDLVKCCTIHIEVKGFSKRNITEYIYKHFDSINEYELGKKLVKEFRHDPKTEFLWGCDHKETVQLCSSPLLLLMICTIWRKNQHLPKNLSDLFIELICCILNQYLSKLNIKSISKIERIPEPYKAAILLLGECMYKGLKENKLSIDRYVLLQMTENVLSVDLALELGFVYEDSPFNSYDVREIYSPPHKLVSEALAGFYLANQIEKVHLKDNEYEVIRSNKYLNMTRVFTIGFLGVKAGELLKHWVVRPSNLYSIAQCFTYIKEENENPVLQDLDNMMSTKMKSYCEQMCETFKSVVEDDRSEHLLKLLKKCCVKYEDDQGLLQEKVISLVDTSSKESLRKSCRAVALMSVIVQIINDGRAIFESENHLLRCISNWDDESFDVLSAEMKYVQTNYNNSVIVLNWGFNSSFLIHLLTHSNLHILKVHNDGLLTEDILSVVIKGLHKSSVKVTLRKLNISCADLHNIDGVLLGKLFGVAPELNDLNVRKCSLSSDIVRAMNIECRNSGCKLSKLDISKNDFDDAILCDILEVFPNLCNLNVASCGLSNESFHNIVNKLPKSELLYLDFSKNNLRNLDGETFGMLMKKLPKLVAFSISHCRLSGNVVNEVMVECGRMNVVLKVNFLNLKGNDLSDINGKSLAELVRVIRQTYAFVFDGDAASDIQDDFCVQSFNWSNYSLTADNLKNLVESVGVNITLNWKFVNLSNINLSSVSGKTLACLFKISPDLINIDFSCCSLSGSIVNEMMEECCRMNVVLKANFLHLQGNDLSDIDGKTLAELFRVIRCYSTFKWSDYSLTADNIEKLVESVDKPLKMLFKNSVLSLNSINLSSLSGKTLACFLKILPNVLHINMKYCSLSGSIVNEMMAECGRMNVVLKANFPHLQGNDLSDMDGKSIAEFVRVICQPMEERNSHPEYTSEYNFCFSFCDQSFTWSNYSLTANNLKKLIESVGVNETLNWKKVDLSNIDLSSISGETLACLFKISPDMTNIDLSYCSLSSSTVNEMMEECGRINVVLTDNMLNLKGNDLSDINAITCLS